jgi:hypothetical protein
MTSKSPDMSSEDSVPEEPTAPQEEDRLLAAERDRRGLFFIFDYVATLHPDLDFDALIRLLGPEVGPELEETMRTYEQLLVHKNIEKGFEMALERWRALLLRQLTRRFDTLPDVWAARVASGSADDLECWGERLLDAASLDEIFAA